MPSGAAPMNKVPNRRAAVLLGALRVLSLFVFGVAYGVVVTHLHNSHRFTVASVTIEVDRYYIQWGLAGVALGSLLPWLDGELAVAEEVEEEEEGSGGRMAWDPVVRSIGAFVGIAYAIVSIFSFLPSAHAQHELNQTDTLSANSPGNPRYRSRSRSPSSTPSSGTSSTAPVPASGSPPPSASPALPSYYKQTHR